MTKIELIRAIGEWIETEPNFKKSMASFSALFKENGVQTPEMVICGLGFLHAISFSYVFLNTSSPAVGIKDEDLEDLASTAAEIFEEEWKTLKSLCRSV